MYQAKMISSIHPTCNSSLPHDQQLEPSDNIMVTNSGGNSSGNPNLTSRQRLRWTNELHDRFVDAVAQLGGPDIESYITHVPVTGATPKGVLRIMNVPGLTIYHVKSHLQKYRLAKYIPDPSVDVVKSENKESEDQTSGPENSSAIQISEALKLQMEVQKRLHEQLEVQKQLQLRIEAQGKYLKKIIEEQQRLSGVLPETPGESISAGSYGENGPDSDKNEPPVPAPISEPRDQDINNRHHGGSGGLVKNQSAVNPLSAKTIATDSISCVSSPLDSSKHDGLVQRLQCGAISGHWNTESVVSHDHRILESSSGSDFQQLCSVFIAGGHFDASSTSICNERIGNGSGNDS